MIQKWVMARPFASLLDFHNGLATPALFLISSRVLLTIVALAAVTLIPHTSTIYSPQTLGADQHAFPGVWLRYDAGYYISIAREGYSLSAKDINFFPFFPLLIRLFMLGGDSMDAGVWAGWIVANASFLAAGLILWLAVEREWGHQAGWATLISLCLYPTGFFYSAIYTESVFLLLSVLVWWFSRRRMYALAALCVSLASLTRINGVVLALIPLIEMWMEKPPAVWRKLALTAAMSGAGMTGFLAYNWVSRGSPFAFIQAQAATMNRSLAFPWKTLLDSVNVVLTGAGGNLSNWFMRLITLHDLANIGLFLALSYLAFRWLRPSLAWYNLAGLIFMLCSHGPSYFGVYSGARYVLIFFPSFITLGLLLLRLGRARWLVWGVFTLWLIFLLSWWASGRWVA